MEKGGGSRRKGWGWEENSWKRESAGSNIGSPQLSVWTRGLGERKTSRRGRGLNRAAKRGHVRFITNQKLREKVGLPACLSVSAFWASGRLLESTTGRSPKFYRHLSPLLAPPRVRVSGQPAISHRDTNAVISGLSSSVLTHLPLPILNTLS
ncbi:hypothetical protein RRG08_042532 [Elysia crispata]|uniref:Uncharacterized protein n=1 Tax=Elysia crispata TaxID=231223 RepID=A0AAE0XPS7_9GAST|nr:hypothetical protein RRG08_042532 [Elysia crispata]